jgi:hypothetical protein
MKSFREYLTENKKPYTFKVKVAGDLDKDFEKKLKDCLGKFSVASMSSGKRTPIQEVPLDFPENKNSSVTIWEVETEYPTTSHQMQLHIAEKCGCDVKNIRVRSTDEPTEHYQAQMLDQEKDGKSLLMSELEQEDHQETVGQKHLMNFIKELEKVKHDPAEVEGINDQLLAKEAPKGKSESMPDGSAISPIGSKSTKGK